MKTGVETPADDALETLPNDVAALQGIIRQLQREKAHLIEQFILLRQARFGISSEKAPGQGELFNEAESLVEELSPEDAAVTAPADEQSPSPRGGRKPLPAELPRIDIIHDLPESDQVCACGCQKRVIGEEVSEQLDIIPMQIRVLRHVRKTYACSCGESAPVAAALPPQPLPKSNASSSLLAMLLATKYVDGLPLYRFEKVLSRHGVDIPRQTLARWVIQSSELLQPLHNLLRDHLLAHDVIHVDETVVQVLKEPDKPPTSQSYMWVQAGGPPDQPVVLFDYDSSRSGQVPKRLLVDWQGYLMTDGYEGYNAVAAQPGIIHLCCFAHARRKFIEAQRVQPKGKTGKADVALALIGKLYGVERDSKAAGIDARHQLRQERSPAILQELRTWLDKSLHSSPPKGKLGEALHYLDKYWPKLIRYVERGDLPIDNNRAENAIRPFVVGRKNWLFSDTPKGAQASALIYSLVETAKANGQEPYAWLSHVLRELPKVTGVDDVEKLLPWNLDGVTLVTNASR